MDSDDSFDDILPEARIFETRVDDIWNETLEAYEALYNKNKDEVDEKDDTHTEVVCPKKPKGNPKKKRLTKDLQQAATPEKEDGMSMENLEKMLAQNSKGLSATAKKRIRKVQLEVEQENKRIARETEQTLRSFERSKIEKEVDLIHADDEPDKEIVLKIRYKSKIQRLAVSEREQFSSIFKKVADLLELKASEILLCLGDTNIKYGDTPNSLKLKIFHIIDCYPYKSDETVRDKNDLLIRMQSNDTRKRTQLHIHKLEKLEELMKKYAELRSMDLKNLVFEFDGEKIEGSETPSDLDMESGSCIDVQVLNFKPPALKEEPSASIKPIPESERLEIYDLD